MSDEARFRPRPRLAGAGGAAGNTAPDKILELARTPDPSAVRRTSSGEHRIAAPVSGTIQSSKPLNPPLSNPPPLPRRRAALTLPPAPKPPTRTTVRPTAPPVSFTNPAPAPATSNDVPLPLTRRGLRASSHSLVAEPISEVPAVSREVRKDPSLRAALQGSAIGAALGTIVGLITLTTPAPQKTQPIMLPSTPPSPPKITPPSAPDKDVERATQNDSALVPPAVSDPPKAKSPGAQPSVAHTDAPEPPTSEAVPYADTVDSKAPSCDDLLKGAQAEPYTDAGVALGALQEARRQVVRGNWDASQTAYCKAARYRFANADTFLELAQLILLRRDGGAATEWAQRAVEKEPSKRTYAVLGDALVRSGKLEEARTAWLKGVNVSDAASAGARGMTDADLEEAQRAMEARDYARAEQLFRRVLAFRPDSSVAKKGIETALMRLGSLPPKIF